MDKEQRDAMRDKIRLASPRALRAALQALVDVAAKAEMDFKAADPHQPHSAWFADGVDTAAATAGAELGLPFKWVTSTGEAVMVP